MGKHVCETKMGNCMHGRDSAGWAIKALMSPLPLLHLPSRTARPMDKAPCPFALTMPVSVSAFHMEEGWTLCLSLILLVGGSFQVLEALHSSLFMSLRPWVITHTHTHAHSHAHTPHILIASMAHPTQA